MEQTKTDTIEEIRKVARAILDYRYDPINGAAFILDFCGNGPGCEPGVPLLIDYTDEDGKRQEELRFPLDLWYGSVLGFPGYNWFLRTRDEAYQRAREFGSKAKPPKDILLVNIHSMKKEQK